MAKNRTALLIIIGQCIVAITLAWLVNVLVEFSMAKAHEGALSKQAASDTRLINSEIASLESTVLSIRNRVQQSSSVHIATADEFRNLTSRHQLRIRRMEKQTRTDKPAKSGNETYSIICLGSLSDDVEFLRDLETSFVVKTNNVVMQRYSDDGSIVALGLTLEVREP